MPKKKIVHVISSLKMGGAESFLYDLIQGLGTEQYEHQVIYFHAGSNVERLAMAGISTYHIQGWRTLYDPGFWWRLYWQLKELNPDVIHSALWAANFSARILGKALGVPVICALHAQADFGGRFRTFLDRYTLHLASQVVAVSQGVAESFFPAKRIQDARCVIIPNGIDAHQIRSRANNTITRAALGLTEHHFVIGTVGRFIPTKQLSLLLDSFAQLVIEIPHARLITVGYGPEEGNLRRQAQALGVDRLVQFVIGKSAYNYYPLFDCFVMPSISEGLSIALLEAMSFSLPCVVASLRNNMQKKRDGDVNGHEIITDGETGLVVAGLDQHELIAALRKLAFNASLRYNLGRMGNELIEKKYNLTNSVISYRKLFDGV